jgi:hypothetical protein
MAAFRSIVIFAEKILGQTCQVILRIAGSVGNIIDTPAPQHYNVDHKILHPP